jgi:hypothetical protein
MTTGTASFTKLDFALNYATEWQWAVLPLHSIAADGFCSCGEAACKSEGKHPRLKHGLLQASKDPDQIKAWWDQWPDANVGIATGPVSGIVVLDVDAAKGAFSSELLFDGVDATVFTTPKVKTGAGLHFYYKYPETETVRNSASKLAKFIDVRGEGGYVVAPPSVHVSGKKYEFLNEDIPHIAEFPQPWIDRLNAPIISSPPNGNGNGSSASRVDSGAQVSGIFVPPPNPGLVMPQEINQGTRNQEMTKVAGALRDKGLSEGAIFAALAVENQRICKPPLDDKELHQISRSVSRYQPKQPLNQTADADSDATDYENTLKPYLYGEFMKAQFEEKEILGWHIGKRDIAIIQAATNAGKTTLLRNVALCMSAGRPFMPFYEGSRPVKIAYFDFENDAQDVQRDLAIMDNCFTDVEFDQIKQNLIVIPKGLMGGELFQFNTHEKWANELIQGNLVEFIFVDNVSAAYDLNDENSNAEVTKKVIKPLLKMAYKGNCAFLFAHHYGKKHNEIDTAGVHAGRGASALQALSRTVINMFGDVSKGEPVTVECAKRKTDGGQNYKEVFKLDPDRWFHHTTIVPPPPKRTAYQALRAHMQTVQYPETATLSDLITMFESEFSEPSIRKAVVELYRDGFLDRPSHGEYCIKKKAAASSPQPKNFYEKDDDDEA